MTMRTKFSLQKKNKEFSFSHNLMRDTGASSLVKYQLIRNLMCISVYCDNIQLLYVAIRHCLREDRAIRELKKRILQRITTVVVHYSALSLSTINGRNKAVNNIINKYLIQEVFGNIWKKVEFISSLICFLYGRLSPHLFHQWSIFACRSRKKSIQVPHGYYVQKPI